MSSDSDRTIADWHHELQSFLVSARNPSHSLDLTSEFSKQQDIYTNFAEQYDQYAYKDSEGDLYRGPDICAREAELLLGETKESKILDFGAGTGLVADLLISHGYTNIDGIDCNKLLLLKAQEKGCYKNIFLTKGPPKDLDILFDNTYDLVVSSGTFFVTLSHPGTEFFEQMSRVTKPGGHILIVTNEQYTVCDFVKWDLLQNLQDKGVLEAYPAKKVPGYRLNKSIGDDPTKVPNADVLVYKILK